MDVDVGRILRKWVNSIPEPGNLRGNRLKIGQSVVRPTRLYCKKDTG